MKQSAWSSKCRAFIVNGSLPRGRPRKIWNEVIRNDLKERKVSKGTDAWKSCMRIRPTHASMENRRYAAAAAADDDDE